LAIESDVIRGDMVEAMEFPQLAMKYGVMGVPKIVINEDVEFEGALPEDMYIAQLMTAVKS
jgi:predicted DsbA family dithiol-disulfide isomerase